MKKEYKMSTKTKIGNSGRGTYLIWDHALKSGYIVGYVKNDAGLSADPKVYKTYSTNRGTYVNVAGLGRCYLK